jgi:hypothetical protein
MNRSKHKFLTTFDPEYEASRAKLKKLRGLRNDAVNEMLFKSFPLLLPLQLFLFWILKTPRSLVLSGGSLLGVLSFYVLTEIIFKVQTNVKS